MTDLVYTQLQATIATMQAVLAEAGIHRTLVAIAERTAHAMQNGGKLLVAGNGGSAADAQHLVAEFVVRLKANRAALRAIALTTDTSILTAIGNDFGAGALFERQVEALGQPGDVFLAISTSGNSENIVRALVKAREQGMTTVGFTGQGGGRMVPLCDHLIAIPSTTTMNIQEAHLALEHTLCLLVERIVFGENLSR